MAKRKKPRVCAVIPARLESSRLPRKALADIGGLPMLAHVCHRSRMAKTIDEVYVATDSEEIRQVVRAHGFSVIMTRKTHQTGTDRIAEAVKNVPCEIVVNVQGDEVLLNPNHIDQVVSSVQDDVSVNVAVCVTPFHESGRSGVIKAVLNEKNDVLYFSRADIPSNARTSKPLFLKVCHLVPFRKPFLLQVAAWGRGKLETIEYNEYLRILEKGYRIRAVFVEDAPISVDTPGDLAEARRRMKSDPFFPLYRQAPSLNR